MVWIDPDQPADLLDLHWLASPRRFAPLSFRPDDYGSGSSPLGTSTVRSELVPALGYRPSGPVRMLTQPRRWGWLFNPITVYLAWHDAHANPVGMVAEVTNTPWNQRHRYVVPLSPHQAGCCASFDKELHVSPFLDQRHRYKAVLGPTDNGLSLDLDVYSVDDASEPVLSTNLTVQMLNPTPQQVKRFIFTNPLSTYNVSRGIYTNAALLYRKKVRFVPNPKSVSAPSDPGHIACRDRVSPLPEPPRRTTATRLAPAARRFMLALLAKMRHGQLSIVEGHNVAHFGSADGHPVATIEVLDQRAWWAVATEGSVGLGRGYIEGWWHCDKPTEALQTIIANLYLMDDWKRRKARLSRLRPHIRPRNSDRLASRAREDIAAHYDIGSDFFSLFLDPTLTYSSGVFPTPSSSLAEASTFKYERLLNKLDIGPDDHILEIGSGWGGFAVHAAATRGCRVTTTTISADQYQHVKRRVSEANLDNVVEALSCDWRHLSGRYDKIVSIEMLEAVDWRDYELFFTKVEECLAPSGVAAIQTICIPGQRFNTAKRTEDFIKRFVFPGGCLPSLDAIASSVSKATKLQLVDVEDFTAHYAETIYRWVTSVEASKHEIINLGFDDRFLRLWEFYLYYCLAAFLERHCTVNHVLVAGPNWRPDGLALRPH